MAKALKKAHVIMRAKIEVKVGDTLLYPYNSQVAAGEPSRSKRLQAKYADQECTVVGFSVEPVITVWTLLNGPGRGTHTLIKVRFSDGVEEELLPDAFVYIGKRKAANKKKKAA